MTKYKSIIQQKIHYSTSYLSGPGYVYQNITTYQQHHIGRNCITGIYTYIVLLWILHTQNGNNFLKNNHQITLYSIFFPTWCASVKG